MLKGALQSVCSSNTHASTPAISPMLQLLEKALQAQQLGSTQPCSAQAPNATNHDGCHQQKA